MLAVWLPEASRCFDCSLLKGGQSVSQSVKHKSCGGITLPLCHEHFLKVLYNLVS